MKEIKTLYLKNFVDDFWKKRKLVGAVILVCMIAFAAVGIKNAHAVRVLTEEQQKEIEEYQEKIQEYDEAIADVESSLELATQQVDELQKYVDSSIYMQIDPQNIQVSSVQYAVQTGANTGNILNALVLYINEGGLKEALPEEYRELMVENWRDIVTPSITANLLNITVIHYDAELSQKVLELIKERVQDQVPQIVKAQGEFTLQEISTTHYVKADSGITNTQNNHRNNLKNYLSSKADFENKLISFQNNKENYIEKNKPEVLEAVQPNRIVLGIKYAIVGILFGIAVPAAVFALQYILSNRVRTKEDLRNTNLNVIGSCSMAGIHSPSLERSFMDLELLMKQQGLAQVFINGFCEDEITKQVIANYEKVISEAGFGTEKGFSVYENAEELRKMVSCKGCIFVVEIGKTTYPQIDQYIKLCERFQVTVLGCIVVE